MRAPTGRGWEVAGGRLATTTDSNGNEPNSPKRCSTTPRPLGKTGSLGREPIYLERGIAEVSNTLIVFENLEPTYSLVKELSLVDR